MHHRVHRLTRRQSLKLLAAAMAASLLPAFPGFAAGGGRFHKTIPNSNKVLPVIGMGTWRTFNVGNDAKLLAARTELVKTFFELGGGLIDSSPMYGSAPDVMGHALAQLSTAQPGIADNLFAAEKVWSPAGGSAREQVANLQKRWNIPQFNLLQVHNLSDWREHLAALDQPGFEPFQQPGQARAIHHRSRITRPAPGSHRRRATSACPDRRCAAPTRGWPPGPRAAPSPPRAPPSSAARTGTSGRPAAGRRSATPGGASPGRCRGPASTRGSPPLRGRR